MKKEYIAPSLTIFNLSSTAEDFLATSYEPEINTPSNGMGGSHGQIIPDTPTID